MSHNLKTQLGRITSGVEAHDYIMKEIDPVSHDIMASSADALSTYNDLKLTSTSLGSFSKFKIRLEDAIEDLIANEIPGGDE